MSYIGVQPAFYQLRQPDSPWHAGAPGWLQAPVPMWGNNPNLIGPRRLGVGQAEQEIDQVAAEVEDSAMIAAETAGKAAMGIPRENWVLLGGLMLLTVGGCALLGPKL